MSERKGTVTAAIIGAVALILVTILGFIWQSYREGPPESRSSLSMLPVEEIPGYYFSYSGSDEGLGGTASMMVVGGEIPPAYLLSYELPENDQPSYAGISFYFDEGVDISDYKKIEFNIRFQDGGELIDLYLKDLSGVGDSFRVTSSGTGEMNISVQLDYFSSVNLNAIREVVFNVNGSFERGVQDVVIKNIRFVP